MFHRIFLISLLLLISGCTPKTNQPETKSDANNAAPTTDSNELRIIAWNIESGGNDPAVIAEDLKSFSGYQIYALSEVNGGNFEFYRLAIGDKYESIGGSNRYQDHLQIIYDKSRLELIRAREMQRHAEFELNNGNHRAPLFAHFKDRISGLDFQIVVNHLARGNADFRTQQANGLREWGRDQTLPTIAIGDFNFDFDMNTKTGNDGFRAFIRDNVWTWVEPEEWIDTNWSDKDGKDRYPDSMLDFAFVAGPAKNWKSTCRIIVRDGDFPDNDMTSDHRPLELILKNK